MSVDILGTNCDHCRSMVQCCFTSTETVRHIRTESPGRPPRLSHSSWALPYVWWWCRASCPRISVDVLGANCDQCRSMVQCCFTSTETVKPVLNWANVCRTYFGRTMIRFLTELLVRRIWFGQSKLYIVLNWLVMRCKLRPELAADAQQTAWSKM